MDMHRVSRTESSARVRVEAWSGGKPARGCARDERGQTLTEFALGVPVLLTLLVGVAVLGVAFNNYLTLNYATNTAAQKLPISRGPQTTDPCFLTS